MKQYFFFEIGNFPKLSEEELSSTLPEFEQESLIEKHILIGSFASPSVLSPGKDIEKRKIQEKFDELGGVLRYGYSHKITQNLDELTLCIISILTKKHEEYAKKLCFGITLFSDVGGRQQNSFLQRILLTVKKKCQKLGISVRFINRDFRSLDTGTYHKEALWKEEHTEFFIFEDQNGYILGETLAAQDVELFARRDFGKPVRDMNVGMLPPKLALMMVNFSRKANGSLPSSIWDPFCGTGSILIEAEKIGITTFGSDISVEMVKASQKNMRFFFPKYDTSSVFEHDVMQKLSKKIHVEAIVSEGCLGPIFHHSISLDEFQKAVNEVSPVYFGFFQNLSKSFSGKKIILSVPFWKMKNGDFQYLENILELATEFGYTCEAFHHGTRRGSLEFIRENQVVGREIFRFIPQNL
ncbi:hypothetical protein HZA38_03010 [Candidatus Peregrinibacteria bacterium]|nr:hypothetical protein [Candidatus Peregrinibacteria bacterium]